MELKELILTKKYFLFDLDGTLVDLEDLNFNSFKQTVQKHFDVKFTYKMYLKYFSGIGSKIGFTTFSKEFGKKEASEEDITLWQNEYREIKRYELTNRFHKNVHLIEGAREFLLYIQANEGKIALGTSSSKEFTKTIIKNFELKPFFNAIITVDDVKNTKPNPEIFLKALKKLNGNIEEGIIFEDSPNGIQCAKNTGMDYVVVHTKGKNDEAASSKKYVIKNYFQLLD